jgi:hypothetical protein
LASSRFPFGGPARIALAALLLTAALAALLSLPAAALAKAAATPRTHAKKHKHVKPACRPQGVPAVTISPLSGASAAPVDAQISFRGAPVSDLHEIAVVGSISGVHHGRLRSYHAAKGASYVLSSPFTEGEHVEVHAEVKANGGCRKLSSKFTVARQAQPVYEEAFEYPGTPGEQQQYESNNVKPPVVTIAQPAGAASAPGDIFATPYLGPGEHGPMIFESDGRLIWFHLLPTGQDADDFALQSYAGQSDLVWWQGEVTSLGFGFGEDVIMSSAYKVIARVKAGNGLSADLHDIELTSRGAAFITAYEPVEISATAAGGRAPSEAGASRVSHRSRANAAAASRVALVKTRTVKTRTVKTRTAKTRVVLDSIVQEIDVKTGLVMWEWDSLGHVPLSQSHTKLPSSREAPYDYFHVDAVQRLADGNLRIAARGAEATYEVGADSGRVLTSETTPATSFAMLEGDEQALPNANKIVYNGQSNAFAEVGPEGQSLFQASFPAGDRAGRVFREPWYGEPEGRPGVATKLSGSNTNVYVSWNGSTQVSSWELLAGASRSKLQPVGTLPNGGFQTEFSLPHVAFVKVLALGAGGEVLAESTIKETVHEGEE